MSQRGSKLFDEALVLVVRGNEAISSQLNTQLKTAGLKPIFVSSGEKGLSVLRHARESNTPLALVICDYALGDLTGYDFVTRTRQDPLLADTKIILTTQDHPMGYLSVFQPMGVNHIVRWPGRAEDLTGAIAEYIPVRREIKPTGQIQDPSLDSEARPFRILAADDNAINLAVLKGFLNLAGYTPDTVVNGAEAVKAFKNLQYDMILMDISMPVMDGVVATLQIREIEKRIGKAPVPIIAITAHYTPSQKKRYLEAGMNDVLAKPISQSEIENCLSEWSPRFETATETRRAAFG